VQVSFALRSGRQILCFKMATIVGRGRTFTVHWSDLEKCVPIGDDTASKAKRRDLFEMFDPQGIGTLAQARTVKSFSRLMPTVAGILDIRRVIHQAWGSVWGLVPPICNIGKDRMDRNQFRVLCIYLWYFVKLWDIYAQLSDTGTGNQKVTQKQFEEMIPWIEGWGVKDVAMSSNPDACFDALDRGRQGWILFEELAEFVLRRIVPQISAAGDEECRSDAIRVLRRNHPHLVMQGIPKKERTWNGACPPIPPPGQWRPPMPVELDGVDQGGNVAPSRRFRTQYMCDYLSPQYLPAEVISATSSPSRSRVLSRALTPRPVRPPSDLATGISLIRSSSCPDATLRTQGLDKQALRMKLENQLDMYSTGQMRKLLKVAGGMVIGPGSSVI